MSKKHDNYETELFGCKGIRFLSEFLRVIAGNEPHPIATVVAMQEYGYQPLEKPSGNLSGKMRLDVFYLILVGNEDKTVAVEVKATRDDLLFGEKLQYELGVADYLFLAVPRSLIPDARYVIEDQKKESIHQIGLIDLSSGEIVVFPEKTRILRNMTKLYRTVLQRDHVLLDISHGSADIPVLDFHPKGQLYVNRKYDGLLDSPYTIYLPPPWKRYERYQASPRYRRLIETGEFCRFYDKERMGHGK